MGRSPSPMSDPQQALPIAGPEGSASPEGSAHPAAPVRAKKSGGRAERGGAAERREPGGGNGEKAGGEGATPMFAQYERIKAAHPGCLLFFRMGDFYELFFEDAEKAAPVLQVQLTQRGRHKGAPAAMCGVPVRSGEAYLARLIRAGFRVAICEQMEPPAAAAARGAKGPLRREVVRLVTAGTLSEEALLEAGAHNFLLALARRRGVFGLAWADISTGAFFVKTLRSDADGSTLQAELARLAPAEILCPPELVRAGEGGGGGELAGLPAAVLGEWRGRMTVASLCEGEEGEGEGTGADRDEGASLEAARSTLAAHFEAAPLAALQDAEALAAAALVAYVLDTQKGRLPPLEAPRAERTGGAALEMDAAARRHLELLQGPGGGRAGSLLAELDRTASGAGARLLGSWLRSPSAEGEEMERRWEAVAFFLAEPALAGKIQGAMRELPDGERALARLALGRGGPRDLAALGRAMSLAGRLASWLTGAPEVQDGRGAADGGAGRADSGEEGADGEHERAGAGRTPRLPALLAAVPGTLSGFEALAAKLAAALALPAPAVLQAGGCIAAGWDRRLDDLRDARALAKRRIAALQEKYLRMTGAANLRIRHNRVLGYHIEVPPSAAAKLASKEAFRHRQTLAGAVRFGSEELAALEVELLQADARALQLEAELFEALAEEALSRAGALKAAAAAMALLDATSALARRAGEGGWVRPERASMAEGENGAVFLAEAGRHPVVETALAAEAAAFVANDCRLGGPSPEGGQNPAGGRMCLLTGPNMAGKSTWLRQNALLLVLAQAGSFVPAARLVFTPADRLFSRIGAGDDLARGRSTFMTEMLETAQILRGAGPRSFVILDELGRGTATHDGLALAWAASEQLHRAGARTLFATHYRELAALYESLPQAFAAQMKVRSWQGEIVFLHEVGPGAAEASYGLHVARLAGVPEEVVHRAEEILAGFEAQAPPGAAQGGEAAGAASAARAAHAARAAQAARQAAHPALRALASLSPDSLSPREALEALYTLAALARNGAKGKEAGGGEDGGGEPPGAAPPAPPPKSP